MVDLLGCSILEVRKHIESLWKPGMSWDNYGKNGWHIDHILPIVAFDLASSDGQKRACHYTNLQPLWSFENLAKGAKDKKLKLVLVP